MKLKPIHVNCSACDEIIEVLLDLAATGKTTQSVEVPNAEGGSRDAVFSLTLDPAPIHAHVRERHR